MRHKLILQPIHTSTADIIQCFALGKPLTCEQLNFLDWNQHQLSNTLHDPLLNYYLKSHREKRKLNLSFLLPYEVMNYESIELLKKRLLNSLLNSQNHAVLQFTFEQFNIFKEYTIKELIFWHGNQFLTGSPFYPSGIPPVIYFQWGNLFGIVKYVVTPEEKNLKANILIYFEDLQDRDLDQCVQDYNHRLQHDIQLQNEMFEMKHHPNPTPSSSKTPRLTLSNYFLLHHIN